MYRYNKGMYYRVWVASQQFHGDEPLTYAYDGKLGKGQLVFATLRNKRVPGIVVSSSPKPVFPTKPIAKTLDGLILPSSSLALLEWLLDYYPAPSGLTVSQFVPSALLVKKEHQATSHKSKEKNTPLPALTPGQRVVLEQLAESDQATSLLHGVTGSGKTRIYLERTLQMLQLNKSVLILTPEISLTSPLVKTFSDTVSVPVIVIHSGLSDKQRREAWLQVLLSSEPQVVIGPRSALFSPFTNLGLIVIDEAHDTAYKQDQAPYYQAQRVASKLAQLHHAQLILGSATPSIADYYIASAKKLNILRLDKRAISSPYTGASVHIIDARDRDNFTKDAYISNLLLETIENSLAASEQSLVFLNRRGTARVVLCQMCGWQATCQNCDLPLTYHDDQHQLRCHTCGTVWPAVTSCPQCRGTDVLYRSIGTKAVTDNLKRHFPEANIRRFDSDNIKRESFEQNYSEVADGKVDIVVGTQLLIKGHDLPRLSTVGVISADSSLTFPDYTAEEQTYQLLSQVIGRVGRGHRPGTAIIQTLQPTNRAILAAVHNSWKTFYDEQIQERQAYNYPPFVQLLKLQCARASSAAAQKAAASLKDTLLGLHLPVQIFGPSPRFIEKAQNKYRWQLIVKAKARAPLLEIIHHLPPNWTHDLDPINLL